MTKGRTPKRVMKTILYTHPDGTVTSYPLKELKHVGNMKRSPRIDYMKLTENLTMHINAKKKTVNSDTTPSSPEFNYYNAGLAQDKPQISLQSLENCGNSLFETSEQLPILTDNDMTLQTETSYFYANTDSFFTLAEDTDNYNISQGDNTSNFFPIDENADQPIDLDGLQYSLTEQPISELSNELLVPYEENDDFFSY
ncbi:hypothetical protein TRFO_38554 [Tritrichomonas foetus]|uniref:Uncharacterized protein n=1 Tax=Tritrichomonas foetus TaxID=1144522 RepID=A0A1J4J812_9EUKA|nr:hypothetical protein TRFO_38554 [Tritrichomonas foetus]|eukprot:OHS95338.1 hypothetical protein TRFO_38554 [Tritrichomonas foetus]